MHLSRAHSPDQNAPEESCAVDSGCDMTYSKDAPLLPAADPASCWIVLIVDDDQSVHDITELVLSGETILGRRLIILHAFSAVQARAVLRERPDISVLLLDVVMESEHAGLELVDFVRNDLRNALVRIVLRTGQPGLAPQKVIVTAHDINGYLEKSQITSPQLFCAVYTALSTYRDLAALDTAKRELQSAITAGQHREDRFRLLLDNSPIGLAEVTLTGRCARVNPALSEMLGYSEEELLSKTFHDITHPDDLSLDVANFQQLLDGKCASYCMDKRYFHKSGRIVHAQLNVALLRDETGTPICILSQVQDIGVRIAAQERLHLLTQRLSLAVRVAKLGVWVWDIKSGQIDWDAQMYDLYGVPEGTPIVYETWKSALLPEDAPEAEAMLTQTLENRYASDNKFRIVHPEHGVRYIEASEDVVLNSDNEVVSVVGVNRDVTKKRQMEDSLLQRQAEIVNLSLTDSLTGVANRRKLDEQLETEMNRVQRYGGTLSIAIADLDHFKSINDEYGHEVGDVVLKAFSRTMESHVRESDLIARFGGEEFVIVMPQSGCDAAETVVERIRHSLRRNLIPPLRHAVTASFGVAEMCAGESLTHLFRRADQALYRAKAKGRNRTVIAPRPQSPRKQ
jgi:diguanylate cyclase (GGDEF)-like protein/PAS domain S-box-containing protein